MDFRDYAKLMKKARDRDPAQFDKDMAEDARQMYKNVDRYQDEKLMERYERRQKSAAGRAAKTDSEGGMKPGQSPSLDNPIQMAKGGMTASKRADGIAQRGKTKGRMV